MTLDDSFLKILVEPEEEEEVPWTVFFALLAIAEEHGCPYGYICNVALANAQPTVDFLSSLTLTDRQETAHDR